MDGLIWMHFQHSKLTSKQREGKNNIITFHLFLLSVAFGLSVVIPQTINRWHSLLPHFQTPQAAAFVLFFSYKFLRLQQLWPPPPQQAPPSCPLLANSVTRSPAEHEDTCTRSLLLTIVIEEPWAEWPRQTWGICPGTLMQVWRQMRLRCELELFWCVFCNYPDSGGAIRRIHQIYYSALSGWSDTTYSEKRYFFFMPPSIPYLRTLTSSHSGLCVNSHTSH